LPESYKVIEEAHLLRKHHFAICGENKPQNFSVVNDEEHWGLIQPVSDTNQGDSVQVPGITLKSFFEYISADVIDLAKIDIEGAEITIFWIRNLSNSFSAS